MAIVRETRPEVIVGYNDFGGYGHPDHIRAGQVCQAGLRAGRRPGLVPGAAGRWRAVPVAAAKLYETVFDMSRREEMAKVLAERGVENRWNPPEDETEEQKQPREKHSGAGWQAATGPKTTSVTSRT